MQLCDWFFSGLSRDETTHIIFLIALSPVWVWERAFKEFEEEVREKAEEEATVEVE